VLEEIRRQGLELQVIFNKGAVMCSPRGDKSTGLKEAAGRAAPFAAQHRAVGDAENDHVLLSEAEWRRVANALPPCASAPISSLAAAAHRVWAAARKIRESARSAQGGQRVGHRGAHLRLGEEDVIVLGVRRPPRCCAAKAQLVQRFLQAGALVHPEGAPSPRPC